MCDEWMQGLQFPLTLEQFHRLPRNAAYKYELFNGVAYLSPRPKFFHALLDLGPVAAEPLAGAAKIDLRPVEANDWDALELLFAAAFRGAVPFAGLEDGPRREAARRSLRTTREGGDGPWIEQASFIAHKDGQPVGAILVTLLPDADPSDWDAFRWAEPPAPDCVERGFGRPHLTWVFVHPMDAGQGVATALLNGSIHALHAMGYRRLASTFLSGNDRSQLWHWRSGFRLAMHPGSHRRVEGTDEMRQPSH
jgi:GNAT superfamily N-acetyltransferase